MFTERLAEAKPLVLDGATGTELTRRGVETTLPLWSAAALETAPDVVRQIHVDYLEAGADIITTNTFRTHARNVRSAAKAREFTQKAVYLAREAVDQVGRPAFVAGSVAPLEDCYSPRLTPAASYCQREQMHMVENLVAAGVDLCLIETMNTVHEAYAAAEAAHILKVPFVVSFILDEQHRLLSKEPLSYAVQKISPLEPAAFMLNCIPTRHLSEPLKLLRTLTDLPIGAYGNMGTPDDVVGWASEEDLTPDIYCDHASEWLALGVQIVGSCCGSTPEHTAALRRLVDARYA